MHVVSSDRVLLAMSAVRSSNRIMKLELFEKSIQDNILNDPNHTEFVRSMDSVSFDISGTSYDVLGYKYDKNGILEYVEAKRFPIPVFINTSTDHSSFGGYGRLSRHLYGDRINRFFEVASFANMPQFHTYAVVDNVPKEATLICEINASGCINPQSKEQYYLLRIKNHGGFSWDDFLYKRIWSRTHNGENTIIEMWSTQSIKENWSPMGLKTPLDVIYSSQNNWAAEDAAQAEKEAAYYAAIDEE